MAVTIENAKQTISQQAATITELREEVAWLKKQLFGRKAERLVDIAAEQPELGLALAEEADQAVTETTVAEHTRKDRKKPERFQIPDDLPVEETVLDISEEDRVCLETGEPLVKLREEVSDKLAFRPGYFFIKRTIRPLYASSADPSAGILAAPLPPAPIANCRADISLLKAMLIMKFVDHLPLYRIERIFKRDRIRIQRQTLSSWVMQLGKLLLPLYHRMLHEVLAGDRLFTDSTSLRFIGRGPGCEKGVIWVYCGGPGGGKDPPYLIYDFSVDGSHKHTKRYLEKFSGLFHSDAHGAYEDTAGRDDIYWQPCLAHARRKFVELQSGDVAARKQILESFGQLFLAEREVWKLTSAEARLAYRAEHCAAPMAKIFEVIEEQLVNGSSLPKSGLRKALLYLYRRKDHATTFLRDGNAVIENNLSERSIKPLVIGRKNWLFLGGKGAGEPTAAILSIVQTCQHLGIDLNAYLEHALTTLARGHANIDELLPDRWQADNM